MEINKKQLKRMLDLSNIRTINENTSKLSSIELVKKANNGKVYGISRENRNYYIKTTDKTNNLDESDFEFIGGVHNKTKHSYRSFEDATRHLNLIFEDINRTYGGDVTNILQSDTELLNEKRFILKQPKKVEPEQDFDFGGDAEGDDFDFGGDAEGGDAEGDDFDFGGEGDAEGDDFDFGGDAEGGDAEGGDAEGDDFDFGGEGDAEGDAEGDTEGDAEGDDDLTDDDLDGDDPIKDIQRTTGQLGQQIRDTEDLSSDTQKWVAKSVLSALDLGDMDSDDKKDLIKTIKNTESDKEDIIDTEDTSSGEDYDSFMGDDEYDYEELPMTDIDMAIRDKAYLNLDPTTVSDSNDYTAENEEYDSYMGAYMGDDYDYEELPMTDIDMGIQDKGYLNLDPSVSSESEPIYRTNDGYDSYMDDEGKEGMCQSCMGSGCSHCAGLGYVDETYENNPNIGGDEKLDIDNLLLDDEDVDYINPKAKSRADRDMSTHYNRPAAPGYDDLPSEQWRGHKLPDETRFDFEAEYDSFMEDKPRPRLNRQEIPQGEDKPKVRLKRQNIDQRDIDMSGPRLKRQNIDQRDIDMSGPRLKRPMDSIDGYDSYMDNDEFATIEDELGLPPATSSVDDTDYEHTPLDNSTDNNDYLDGSKKLKYDSYMNDELDPTMSPSPAPSRPSPTKPTPTKEPGRPNTDKPARPSRKPFNPPPFIEPGTEPGPKAGDDSGTHNPETLPDGSPRPWQDGMGKPPWLDNDVEYE